MVSVARRPRWWVAVIWGASVAVAAAAGWWAAAATLQPPEVDQSAPEPPVYTVTEGSVGRSMAFTATATWETTPLAFTGADGTITRVDIDPGAQVDSGDRLFSVDERPVTVAEGAVPAYRDLSNGMKGADVAQLQTLLSQLGYHEVRITGTFDNPTTRAVWAWQRDLGTVPDGIVHRGDVIFVPKLPTRVVLAAAIAVGMQVSPGSDAVAALPSEPRIVVQLAPEQRDVVPLSASVVVEHLAGQWNGRIRSAESSPNGELELILEGPDGGPICGDDCASAIPPDREVHFRTQIVAVPETTGPLVPAAALQTGAGGQVSVITTDGSQLPVTVLAADAGQAVVEGVESGTKILLFGSSGDPTTEPTSPAVEQAPEPSDGGS